MTLPYRHSMFSKLVVLFYSILTLVGCAKEKDQTQQSAFNQKMPHMRSPKLPEDSQSNNESKVEKETIRGVVYVSKVDSGSHLALESEDGTVYLIIGPKQWELNNLRNRKVEIWGYLHENIHERGTRDSIEVIQYEVIHGEGG